MCEVINKALSNNPTFEAKFRPCSKIKVNSDIIQKFEQITTKYPNFELVQFNNSFPAEDCFKLYKDNKLLNLDFEHYTSMIYNSSDEMVNRLVEIFDNIRKKANL